MHVHPSFCVRQDVIHTEKAKNRLSFWNYVSRAPLHAVNHLQNWVWKKLSAIECLFPFYEKYVLNTVLQKLDGGDIQECSLLTSEEIYKTLWAIAQHLGDKSLPLYDNFVSQLHKKGYIKSFDTQSKPDFLHQIIRYRTLQITGQPIHHSAKDLEKYLNPLLFIPSTSDNLDKFTAEEINEFGHLLNASKASDSRIIFESFFNLLKNSSLRARFLEFNNLSSATPFLVGHSLVSKTTHFEFPGESCYYLEDLISKITSIKDLKSIEQKIDNDDLDIETATTLGMISIFLNFETLNEELFDSEEKKLFFRILKKIPTKKGTFGPRYCLGKWQFLESKIEEITRLRAKREKNEKIDLSDLTLFVNIIEMLKPFNCLEFLKQNSGWPCKIVKELALWKPLEIEVDPENLSEDLKKYHSQLEEEVKKRIKNVDKKYTPKLKDIQFLDALLKNLTPFKDCLSSTIIADIEAFLNIYSTNQGEESHFDKACPINLCFFKNKSISQIWSSEAPLLTKIMDIASAIFMPFTHTNFSLLVEGKRHKFGLGIRVYEDEIRGEGSTRVKSYSINPTRLLNRELSSEESLLFKRLFFQNFIEVKNNVNKDHYYPNGYKNIFKKFFSGFIPSIFADKPEPFLSSKDSKEMFCSEFAFQMVVETLLKTCEMMNLEKPDTLSLFGARSLKGLTPNDLRSLWLKRGILIA